MMKTGKIGPTTLRALLLISTALLLLALQVIAIITGVTTPVERTEYSAHDFLFCIRGVHPPAPEIVIVGIDDFSFNWTGYQWPWPHQYMAEIVDQLNKGKAKVVGLDIFLFEKDPDQKGDAALAHALGESKSAASIIQIFKDADQKISTLRRPLTPYQYVWPIIISQSTCDQVKDEFETEFADSVIVKGKTEPVNIYKVTARIAAQKEIVPGW